MLAPIASKRLHEQIALDDAIVAELAETLRHFAGEQPVGELAPDGGRNLEAVAAAAAEVGIARDAVARADERIPVRRHVVERRVGFDQLHAGERWKAAFDASLNITDEAVIGSRFVIIGIDVEIFLGKSAADNEAVLAEWPVIGGIDAHR